MAIGTQFSSLVSDLRAELRRSTDVSVGVDDLATLKRFVNRAYRVLIEAHEWPHLRNVFAKIPLVAGENVYDFPPGFDPDNVRETAVWLGSLNMPIKRGINLDAYSFLDPSEDQRSDPVLAWDLRFDVATGQTQIEVWPVPASASYTFQFVGPYNPPKLVNDSDPCLLDDELVIGFAAARGLMSQKSDDANYVLAEAQSYLLKKTQKPKGDAQPVQMGLGMHRQDRFAHPSIVIKPTGST